MILDALADAVGKFARTHFRGVDLFQHELASVDHRLEIEAQVLGTMYQKAEFFIEDKHRGTFPAGNRRDCERERKQRLACPCRAEDQHA